MMPEDVPAVACEEYVTECGDDDRCDDTWSDGSDINSDECGNGDCCDDTWSDTSEDEDLEESIYIRPSSYVLAADRYIMLKALNCPCNDVLYGVTWESSDPTVATVDSSGKVTTKKDGKAVITATYNGMTATCPVTVDSRPLVVVEERSDEPFWVNFVDQKEGEPYCWRSVGCDLELPENRDSYNIWEDAEEYLNPAERNHKYNCGYSYSYDQLALLYRLDPFGVIAYVKNYVKQNYGGDIKNQLIYKDNVYIAIFGYDEDHFYFRPDENGNIVYYRLNNSDYRENFYSHAEALFGQHGMIDTEVFWKAIVTLLFDVTDYILQRLG